MPEKIETTIQQRLLTIQQKLKAHKGQFNSFGNYKYRSCEDILESIKPLLAETGTVVTLTDEIVLIGDWHYVKATVRLSGTNDAVETVAFAREPELKKGMDASQITGTASSYARKYALNGLFCIDDTKDSDATNKGENDEQRKPAAYKAPAKQAEPVDKEAVKTARRKTVDDAYFEFTTLHADKMPDGKVFNSKFFANEILAAYANPKILTAHQKKTFKWDLTSVNKLAESVLPENCLTDIKVAPDA